MDLSAHRRSLLRLMLGGAAAGVAARSSARSATPWQALTISSPPQGLAVLSQRRSYPAVFQSEAQLLAGGPASGFLALSGAIQPLWPGGLTVVFSEGSAQLSGTGTARRVLLRGTAGDGSALTIAVTPVAGEDCLIYTTIGTQVRATWMADGVITLLP